MSLKLLIFLLVFTGGLTASEEEAASRIFSHLHIKDQEGALKDARAALKQFPTSHPIQAAFIEALSASGKNKEALQIWSDTFAQQGNQDSVRLLESIAWGVLRQSEESAQLPLKLKALGGAASTRDAKAIPLLITALRSSNAYLRGFALTLATSYPDLPIKKEVERLLKEERDWLVRLWVYRTVGALHLKHLKGDLEAVVAHHKTSAEEKAAAIEALLSMTDDVEEKEITTLFEHPRAGLRQFACALTGYLEKKEMVPYIEKALSDSCPEVRIAALNVLALNGSWPSKGGVAHCYQDDSALVSITAAWAGRMRGDVTADKVLKEWAFTRDHNLRRMAAGAIARLGKKGSALAYELMDESSDPYVQATLAISLIGQRTHTNHACDVLYSVFFSEKEEKWMWENWGNPLFMRLAPSRATHIPMIPQFPQIIDQITRLEVLNYLAVLEYPRIYDVIKEYLHNQVWDVSFLASITLLKEGGVEALDAVRALLRDANENIRLHAALLLSMFGKDPEAIEVLMSAYESATREQKGYIIEALGQIGEGSTIPFLAKVMFEPFQSLRLAAATAIIQCIYH